MGEKILYVRVSTQEQNTARQEALKDTYKVDKVFIDKVSGKDTNRAELKAMLNYVREGDTVIVESYSRASRSTKDLLNLVEELNNKKVKFISIKENIDTSTPAGKLMLTFFAGLYEFERECMLQRQREGIAIAKQEGKYRGRKEIEVDKKDFIRAYSLWKSGEITAVKAMKMLSLKRGTFYKKVKEYENKNNLREVV